MEPTKINQEEITNIISLIPLWEKQVVTFQEKINAIKKRCPVRIKINGVYKGYCSHPLMNTNICPMHGQIYDEDFDFILKMKGLRVDPKIPLDTQNLLTYYFEQKKKLKELEKEILTKMGGKLGIELISKESS